MKRQSNPIHVVWEYIPTPDADARLEAAFDMIFSKELPDESDLTENDPTSIMLHDHSDEPPS